MRLFVALPLPDAVVDHLRCRVRRGSAVDESLRWVPADQWHLTLAFYGDVDAGRVDDLVERLARATARTRPYTLSLGAPGRFGSARRARVVWLGLGEGVEPTRRLAASARAAGRRVGLTGDDLDAHAPYRPHITLARAAPPRPVDDALAALDCPQHPVWQADQALLVHSELGAGAGGRARHSVHSRLAFAGDRPQSRPGSSGAG